MNSHTHKKLMLLSGKLFSLVKYRKTYEQSSYTFLNVSNKKKNCIHIGI